MNRTASKETGMAHVVCPWWLGYFLVSPLRRLLHDPRSILTPFVSEGMTVLEPGPGMGFFTLELARLVGSRGRVIAVDVQTRMLQALVRRARGAGLEGRIEVREAKGGRLGIENLEAAVDFALVFAVVHELPDAPGFFAEIRRALRDGGRVLVAEPTGHVSERAFAATLEIAERAGLTVDSRPVIRRSRSAVLVRRH